MYTIDLQRVFGLEPFMEYQIVGFETFMAFLWSLF